MGSTGKEKSISSKESPESRAKFITKNPVYLKYKRLERVPNTEIVRKVLFNAFVLDFSISIPNT